MTCCLFHLVVAAAKRMVPVSAGDGCLLPAVETATGCIGGGEGEEWRGIVALESGTAEKGRQENQQV